MNLVTHNYRLAIFASFLLALLLFNPLKANCATNEYYVAPDGSATGSGTFNDPWSIQHAANGTALPNGAIVWVQAGAYPTVSNDTGQAAVVVQQSSTDPNAPVKFIGYLGDATNKTFPTLPLDNDDYRDNLANYQASFPFFKNDNGRVGTAFHLKNCQNVVFENFHIREFRGGISVNYSDNVQLNNCIVTEMGLGGSYNGKAIVVKECNASTVNNCFVMNCEAEGINLNGSAHCGIYDSRIYVDSVVPGGNGMDYSFAITSNTNRGATYNTISRCSSIRVGRAGSHSGKGFLIGANSNEPDATDNTIEDCLSDDHGSGFQIRGLNAHHNTIRRCVSKLGAGLILSNGSYSNTLQNCRILRSESAVRFDHRGPDDIVSYNNFFVNCEFEYWWSAINVVTTESSGHLTTPFNTFVNCTFFGHDNPNISQRADLFKLGANDKWYSVGWDFLFMNCLIHYHELYDVGAENPDAWFLQCNFSDNLFAPNQTPTEMPGATTLSATTHDPQFVEPLFPVFNMSLQPTSPLIDAGGPYNSSSYDVLGQPRHCGVTDIGAREHQGGCSQ